MKLLAMLVIYASLLLCKELSPATSKQALEQQKPITAGSQETKDPHCVELPKRTCNKQGHSIGRAFCNCNSQYANIDGFCNNRDNPDWGAAGTALRRLLPPAYEDSLDMPIGWNRTRKFKGFPMPSPRSVSILLLSSVAPYEEEEFTDMLTQWGQFFSHDLSLTPSIKNATSPRSGNSCRSVCEPDGPCFPIPVPKDDPRIKRSSCLSFTRSASLCNSNSDGLREQLNSITSYIDASMVYGSSERELSLLRDMQDPRGLLKVGSAAASGKHLLPFDRSGTFDCKKTPTAPPVPCFMAGDVRANEQLGLTSLHTLWMREHNRIAKVLSDLNPSWTQETVFQEARKIVIAEIQHITYTEYLPKILGASGMQIIGRYRKYDPNIDASVSNEFATAAFRFGHAMVKPFVLRLNSSLHPVPQGHLFLHDAFFSPWRITEDGGLDPIIRGYLVAHAKRMLPGDSLSEELTEKLFSTAETIAQDLASLNIQRGRDHGLASYTTYREYCGLQKWESFDEVPQEISDTSVLQKLRTLYGHPDNIDLWVGMLSEDSVAGACVGPTFICILAEQFKATRDGDRFWYERRFGRPKVRQIRHVSLARIICDNADDIRQVPADVFRVARYPYKYLDCKNIPEVDLQVWQSKK